jgi:hypothetical protein
MIILDYAVRKFGFLLNAAAAVAVTGLTVIPVVGKNEGGEPASVKVWVTGVPKVTPLTSKSVATTLPAPGATEVEKAHGVGVSTPVRSTAGCATPEESVTTTEVEANAAPDGVGTLAPLAMATMMGIKVELTKFS